LTAATNCEEQTTNRVEDRERKKIKQIKQFLKKFKNSAQIAIFIID